MGHVLSVLFSLPDHEPNNPDHDHAHDHDLILRADLAQENTAMMVNHGLPILCPPATAATRTATTTITTTTTTATRSATTTATTASTTASSASPDHFQPQHQQQRRGGRAGEYVADPLLRFVCVGSV